MNFSTYLVSKIDQNQSMLWISPYVCRQRKIHFDTGSQHVSVPPSQISSNYLSHWRNYGHINPTSSISTKSPQVLPPPTDLKGKFEIYVPYGCHINVICIWADPHQKSEKSIFWKLSLEILWVIPDGSGKTWYLPISYCGWCGRWWPPGENFFGGGHPCPIEAPILFWRSSCPLQSRILDFMQKSCIIPAYPKTTFLKFIIPWCFLNLIMMNLEGHLWGNNFL